MEKSYRTKFKIMLAVALGFSLAAEAVNQTLTDLKPTSANVVQHDAKPD